MFSIKNLSLIIKYLNQTNITNLGRTLESFLNTAIFDYMTKKKKEKKKETAETASATSLLTLSLPRVPKIKIQDESQISFCKILKSK